jgi:hypothetical protein
MTAHRCMFNERDARFDLRMRPTPSNWKPLLFVGAAFVGALIPAITMKVFL